MVSTCPMLRTISTRRETDGSLRNWRLSLAFSRLAGPILATLVALIPILAAPAAVGSKPEGKPRLNVVKLNKPPAGETLVGERVKIEGDVRNQGRRAGRSTVKLIVPSAKGSAKGRKLDKTAVKRFGPRSTRTLSFSFEVDERLAPQGNSPRAEHELALCVRRHGEGTKFRCRSTKRPLTVGLKPLPARFEPGGRSVDDPLFPQIGNTGYDVGSYKIDLDYSPIDNTFREGTKTTINATATQDLGEFSLDFQRLDVSKVMVDGERAAFELVDAKPELEGATQPVKLIVLPDAGIPSGNDFEVVVHYTGEPVEIIDPDGSSEGWVPACVGAPSPATCDGGVVVNEPVGAAGWFPNNNHPSDKATYDTAITVPSSHTALGIGELVSNDTLPNGRVRWKWTEDDPAATYLTTATVGRFNFTVGSMGETLGPRTIPTYTAIDITATPVLEMELEESYARTESMINFLGNIYGGYPFDSIGAIADNVPTLGYALEVQTKPVYASVIRNDSTVLHELAHQWWGNDVSPSVWTDLWFNEGWAEWSTWYWEFLEDGGTTSPEERFDDEYSSASDDDWATPSATLNGDPALMFSPSFPTYTRGAMTIQGYREIVGDAVFFTFTKDMQQEFGGANISTRQFIDFAKQASGFSGAQLDRLEAYFQQWLYGDVKPTITPDNF
jgi:hypothetical protein